MSDFRQPSVYLSYNHLDNDAQPMTFYSNAIGSAVAPAASGGLLGADSKGNQKMYFGDTGVVASQTDNYKMKLGYDFGNSWFALLNVAYEDRSSKNTGNSYVSDAAGNTVWNGAVNQNGQSYSVKGSSLGANELDRNSLNVGVRLKGDLSPSSHLEANVSIFDVLKDHTTASTLNPQDPKFANTGQVTDYGKTGWHTMNAKWTLDKLGSAESLNLTTGVSHEAYELNRDVYDANNYATSSKDKLSSSSGGETSLSAVFAQLGWLMGEQWDSTLGLRYEAWRSKNGYYANDDAATPELDLVHTHGRSESRFSPKASIGYLPNDNWVLRYSVAQAYRFPIVEELYSQYQAYQAQSLANPGLKPEDGVHQNVMVERSLANGYVRMNVFHDVIDDVIESQTTTLDGGGSLRTFIPVDRVRTTGMEFISNLNRVFSSPLDLRFNLTYTDSKIAKNSADPSIVGKRAPRMPEWRSNLLATWHLNELWNVSANLQYAGNSYGQLDNSDQQSEVYGAIDGYTRIGVKTDYRFNKNVGVSFGIDNLTNETSYVAHPWPGRTFFLTGSYDM